MSTEFEGPIRPCQHLLLLIEDAVSFRLALSGIEHGLPGRGRFHALERFTNGR